MLETCAPKKATDLDDLLVIQADSHQRAGCIEIIPDRDTLDRSVSGLDQELLSDECLRAMSFAFEFFKEYPSIEEAPAFVFPTR